MMKNNTTCSNTVPKRILQITDFHLFADSKGELLGVNTAHALEGVVKHIKKEVKNIDLILATGDLSQDGTQESYQRAHQILKILDTEIVYLPGNHDNLNHMKQALGPWLNPITDLANWRVVSLNSMVAGSDEGYLAEEQFQLLQKACTNTEQYVLLAVHHNPVPVGSTWLDPMMIANAHILFHFCEKHPNIQAIIWGHVHQSYESVYALDQPRRHVHLLATPATCIQFKPKSQSFALDDKQPGYRIIELFPNGEIQTQVIRVNHLNIKPDHQSKGY